MTEFGPLISNETLAVIVVISSFIILCLFLWVSSTFLSPHVTNVKSVGDEKRPDAGNNSGPQHIPCERDGAKVFIALRDVLQLERMDITPKSILKKKNISAYGQLQK